jgi:ABC-type antimicrobial peptide transport system permease subunit
MFPSQVGVAVLGVLGSAALILAGMGLYSVIAYGVALRSHEIGIRLALGATTRQVRAIFVKEAFQLLACGLGAGAVTTGVMAWALHTRVLFMRMPNMAGILTPALVLSLVALFACLVSTRAAARIELVGTLRAE